MTETSKGHPAAPESRSKMETGAAAPAEWTPEGRPNGTAQ